MLKLIVHSMIMAIALALGHQVGLEQPTSSCMFANGLDVPHHLFLQAGENPYIFGRIWRKNSEAARSDLLAGSDGDDA